LIDKTLAAPLPPNISKLDRHNALQERLRLLGEELEFVPAIEVATGYRKFKASGRFDVVWEPKDGSAKIIFEIDSCWRHESLLKLGRVGANALKLWIYYGQRPFPNKPDEPGNGSTSSKFSPIDWGSRVVDGSWTWRQGAGLRRSILAGLALTCRCGSGVKNDNFWKGDASALPQRRHFTTELDRAALPSRGEIQSAAPNLCALLFREWLQ
jgi:hypothetical protein